MELGRRPSAVALVTGRATGSCRNMVGVLAGCIGAVVATGAVGRSGKGTVVGLGASPDAG